MMVEEDNRPLTIAHVMAYYMPGLGYQENYLPFKQADLGHRVHIVTGDRYVPHDRYDEVYAPQLGHRIVRPGTAEERGVIIRRLAVTYENKKRHNLFLSGLINCLNEIAPDVIHLHGVTGISTIQVLLSSLFRRSTIVCDHHLCHFNMVPLTFLKRIYYAAFRFAVLPILKKRVGMWLPINEDAAGVLNSYLGISGNRVNINRLGMNVDAFTFDSTLRAKWRDKNGVGIDDALIVYAGKVDERKCIGELIEAASMTGSDVKLIIAGDGSRAYSEYLRSKVKILGIDSKVLFLPMQDHASLPALFNGADLGIWPGDGSITAIEAAGTGLPVILADPPGRKYAEVYGYVRRGSVEDMANLFRGFRPKTEEERAPLAKEFAKDYGWGALARQSIGLYRAAQSSESSGQDK